MMKGVATALLLGLVSVDAEWKLLVRQSAGKYMSAKAWESYNTKCPNCDNYSILNTLSDKYKEKGKFTFRISYPLRKAGHASENIWKQSSNPMTKGKVQGYQAVNIKFKQNRWGGLESGFNNGNNPAARLDGSVNHGNWFYAVGSRTAWGGGIPGPTWAAKRVELYVKIPGKCPPGYKARNGGGTCDPQYKLILRQSAGKYMKADKWLSYNTRNPKATSFSIASTLDDGYRGPDGKFEFMIKWPLRKGKNYNQWKQMSNPVKDHGGVQGYHPIDCSFRNNRWNGLESGWKHGGNNPIALMDGSVNHGNWFYAVGSRAAWSGGIPGAASPEKRVELWVLDVKGVNPAKTCWCTGGVAATGKACSKRAHNCATCFAGHKKAGGKCNPSYKLLIRQTAGKYLNPSTKWRSYNTKNPKAPNFSILSTLNDDYKNEKGKFQFILKWPKRTGSNSNTWMQSTNPVSYTGAVQGYEAIEVKFTANRWGGLESGLKHGGKNPIALLDGTVNHGNWFYAIGSRGAWSGGIPGSQSPEKAVELWVLDVKGVNPKKTCNCPNGVAAKGSACPKNGVLKCTKCTTAGFSLNKGSCRNDYKLIFRQSAGTYMSPVSKWMRVNPNNPKAPNFSILNQLDNSYKGKDGKFTFMIKWPLFNTRSGQNYNTWKQSTNPVTYKGKISGYKAIKVYFRQQRWGGLESGYRHNKNNPVALMDGSVNHGNWFYAVGSRQAWNNGIPGPYFSAKRVELYVYSPASVNECVCTSGTATRGKTCPKQGAQKCKSCDLGYKLSGGKCVTSMKFKLLFRQTAGTYKNPVSKWLSVNPKNPKSPNFSILNTLDNGYRGSDGKFTFMIKWPLRKGKNTNIWKQYTNPVQKAGSLDVEGYDAVNVNFRNNRWRGLESGYKHGGNNPVALIDGSVNHGNWFYAIGSRQAWGGGIPGAASAEKRVELWVYDDDGRASGGGSSGKCKTDVNSDKKVDIEDLLSLLGEYGNKC